MAKVNDFSKLKNEKEKKETKTILCTECNEERRTSEFYKSYSNNSGIIHMCKGCLSRLSVDEQGKIDKEKFIATLRKIDKPYIEHLFIKNINKYDTAKSVIGYYLKDLSLHQYRTLTFKDSIYEKAEQKTEITGSALSDKDKYALSDEEREALIDKWGDYTDFELVKFERKYKFMSKGYQILTPMHEESLINVCRLEVFYNIALQQKNAAEIKLFGEQLSKAKQEAKLNPNQLSKNDLTSTGANSFGEIVKLVSKRDGVCRLPLKYFEQPNDKIDYAIYQFIAYERALRGLPEIEYSDVYKWYIDDIKKYEESTGVKINYNPVYLDGKK